MRSLPITIAVVLSLSQSWNAVAQSPGQLGGSLWSAALALNAIAKLGSSRVLALTRNSKTDVRH
jgi:hypothetical protein